MESHTHIFRAAELHRQTGKTDREEHANCVCVVYVLLVPKESNERVIASMSFFYLFFLVGQVTILWWTKSIMTHLHTYICSKLRRTAVTWTCGTSNKMH